jgi:hypothetical protein
MKSTEVYAIIRTILGPWCKAHGFKRTSGGILGWYKPIGDLFLVLSFQCFPSGWDSLTGSKFIAEFQISDRPSIGAGIRRKRLPDFLDDEQREQLIVRQNAVIAKLNPPRPDHMLFKLPQPLIDMVLDEFKPVTRKQTRWA